MISRPRVSIITPTYNRASFLEETILSVISQDYPNLQYIVLDDGSTDRTREVLRQYEDRIRWESHPNMGETKTVNKGFSMATGEIIGVVNSDDPLLPGAVSTIVDFMLKDDEIIVSYPDWDMIDSEGNLIQHIETYEYSYLDMLRWHHCVPGPGTFFRDWVVERLGGRDEQFRYVADFDFWLRAGLLGPFARVPKTLATFRLHEDGASSNSQGVRMAEEHILLARKILSIGGLRPEIVCVRREALSSAYYVAGMVLGDYSAKLKRGFFAKSIALSPSKYLLEYRNRLFGPMVPSLLGNRVTSLFNKLKGLFAMKVRRCPK